jgi:hypothetical protein
MNNSLALAFYVLILLWSSAPSPVSSFTVTSTPTNSRTSSPCQQPTSTSLFAKRKGNKPLPKVVSQLEYIRVNQDGHDDLWKTMDIVEILNQGGVGCKKSQHWIISRFGRSCFSLLFFFCLTCCISTPHGYRIWYGNDS